MSFPCTGADAATWLSTLHKHLRSKLQLLVFCRKTSIKFSRGRTWICYTFNIFIIFNIFQSASFTVHFVCHLLSLFPYNHRFISWFEGFFQFHDLKTLKVLIKITTRKKPVTLWWDKPVTYWSNGQRYPMDRHIQLIFEHTDIPKEPLSTFQ